MVLKFWKRGDHIVDSDFASYRDGVVYIFTRMFFFRPLFLPTVNWRPWVDVVLL